MRRSVRRLIALLLALPVLLVVVAFVYQLGMIHLEGKERTFGQAIEWASETITTTGYGLDAGWSHPMMQVYVILIQFLGLLLVFLVFPIFLLPFFEERFEVRLPTALPEIEGHVLIYRYGPQVESLVEQLRHAEVPVVFFEEDEGTARRLHERGRRVVFGNLDRDDPDLSPLKTARALVANGSDHDNAAITLSARAHGFEGTIVALIENPARRSPMLRAGATASFTPVHVLAASLAAKASVRMSPRVTGVRHLGGHLEIAEVRIGAGSRLVGQTLAQGRVWETTGATVIARWVDGTLEPPDSKAPLDAGTIVVVAGSQASLERLAALATPISRPGRFLVVGRGETAFKVSQLLCDVDEEVQVLAPEPAPAWAGAASAGDAGDASGPGTRLAVDRVVGDPLDEDALVRAGVREAQAVILALDNDSETLFVTAIVRHLDPGVAVIAGVVRAEHVSRIRRAGADFALSISQVAGELLSYQLLGEEAVTLDADIKVVPSAAGSLAGQTLVSAHVRSRTGCSVIAIERGSEVIVDFAGDLEIETDDILYLVGTGDAVERYFQDFPDRKSSATPRVVEV